MGAPYFMMDRILNRHQKATTFLTGSSVDIVSRSAVVVSGGMGVRKGGSKRRGRYIYINTGGYVRVMEGTRPKKNNKLK